MRGAGVVGAEEDGDEERGRCGRFLQVIEDLLEGPLDLIGIVAVLDIRELKFVIGQDAPFSAYPAYPVVDKV